METLRKVLAATDLSDRPRLSLAMSIFFLVLLAASAFGGYMTEGQVKWWLYVTIPLAAWLTYRDFRRWRRS